MTLRLRFCPLQRLRWVSVGPAVSLRIHRKPPKCNGLLVSSFPQKCKHPGLLQFVDTINVRVEGAVENQCERERERDAIYRNLHACAKRGTSLTHAHAVGTRWVVMRRFDRFVGPDCPVPFIHHCTTDQEKCLDDFPMVVNTGVPLFQPKLHMRSPDWPGWWFEICLCFHPANDRWNDDPQPRGELPNFLLLTVRRFCCEVSLIEGKRHCWCLTPVFSLLKSNCLGQIQKIYWIRLYLLASS